MTKIDPATGLPELPEGYFWRIKKDSAGTRTHLMKKRAFGISTSVHSRYIFPRYYPTAREAMRGTAQKVLDESWEKVREQVILSKLVGGYPPKRLEQ